jgi:hypothetical protein
MPGEQPKRRSKKKTVQPELSSNDAVKEAQKTIKNLYTVEEVIKEAFTRFYDGATLKQQKVKDLENLDVIVSEFLKSFIILGYDFNGEKVHIMHAGNPLDRDALIEHLRTTFIGIING